MESWTIELPFPPLNLNEQRHQHWAVKRREIKNVREVTWGLVHNARIPRHDRVEVRLTYFPPDRRRRDADNLVACLKPVCDALIDAGVVSDDDPDHMVKYMPTIGSPDTGRRGRLYLSIGGLAPLDSPLPAPAPTRRR